MGVGVGVGGGVGHSYTLRAGVCHVIRRMGRLSFKLYLIGGWVDSLS